MFSFAKKLVDRFEGSASTADSNVLDSYFKSALQINNNGYGLRVLNVEPHSAGHQAGLESWFDYIIRVNGRELPMLYPSLSHQAYSINDDGSINYGGSNVTPEQVGQINYEILQQELTTIANNSNGSHVVTLDVWNAKGGIIRQVSLTLIKDESSQDPPTPSNTLDLFNNTFQRLGVTLLSQHLTTATFVWRILNTHPGSPAFQAQLIPYSDYVIGCDLAFEGAQGLLSTGGESLLSRTVLSYYNHHNSISGQDYVPITLYVYNHDYDILRPVTVNLSRGWNTGGQQRGILGCDVGYGLIHRLPEVVGKFAHNEISDDILFESNENFAYQPQHQAQTTSPIPPTPAGDYFVPLSAPQVGTAPPPSRKKNTLMPLLFLLMDLMII